MSFTVDTVLEGDDVPPCNGFLGPPNLDEGGRSGESRESAESEDGDVLGEHADDAETGVAGLGNPTGTLVRICGIRGSVGVGILGLISRIKEWRWVYAASNNSVGGPIQLVHGP